MISNSERDRRLDDLQTPSITKTDAAEAIISTEYINHDMVTICIATCRNGYVLVGASACQDSDNFDPDLGAKLAFDDCVRQVWPLEGYLLKQRFYDGQATA
ncbi:MAG: Gp49 family protein [Gammaproteobacteria bacterium]